MFCMKCGAQLQDGAVFCMQCGTRIGSAPASAPAPEPDAASAQSIRLDGGTRFVAAKCPNCGAALEVDAAKEAAICPYCNTPYIVDKAINMVQIGNVGGMSIGSAVVNVNGVSAGPMVERVLYLEKNLRFKQALQICERALEIDPYNMKAMEAETRLRKEIDSYIYDEIKLPKGSISIRREDIMIQEKKSSIKLPYTLISSVKGEDLIFEILKIQLKGEDKPRTFRLADGQEGRAKAFAEHIKHAMTGAYDM